MEFFNATSKESVVSNENRISQNKLSFVCDKKSNSIQSFFLNKPDGLAKIGKLKIYFTLILFTMFVIIYSYN